MALSGKRQAAKRWSGLPRLLAKRRGDARAKNSIKEFSKKPTMFTAINNYSKVKLERQTKKVEIFALNRSTLGAFQTLRGQGCPTCAGRILEYRIIQEKAKKVRKINTITQKENEQSHKKRKIISNFMRFEMTPKVTWTGKGSICGVFKNTKEYIAEATRRHNGKFDYSKTIGSKQEKKIIITCPKQGISQAGEFTL